MGCEERVERAVREHKFIAILRGLPQEQLLCAAQALYDGGVRLIECTFDHTRADCVEANRRMISTLAEHFGGRMLVGCGTALTLAEVGATLDAGGQFVISPNEDEAVIRETRRLGMASLPGAMTPSEIVSAWNAGANFVKLFPAGELGAGYVKAVRAPLKHIPMLAVGGVTPENIPQFLAAGVCGFGVGSPVLPKDALERGDWQAVARRAAEFVRALS